MRLFKDFMYFLGIYFIMLPCVETSSLDACQLTYGESVVLHTSYKDGNRSCCKSIVCGAGFQAVLCSTNDQNSTSCSPCPPNTYQSYPTDSVDMKYCDAKTTCGDGMKVEDDDSTTEDRRCLCDLDRGYCNPLKNRSTFCQRRSCLVGMELNQDCSCSECPYGYFKDANGSMPCKMWRKCRDKGRRTVAQGNATTDTVCNNLTSKSSNGSSSTAGNTVMSAILPGNGFSSDAPVHSKESHQNNSDLDQTKLENENTSSWGPVVIVAGIAAVVVAFCVFVCVFVCRKYRISQHIYTRCKSCPPPAQTPGNGVDYHSVRMNPPPTDHFVQAERKVHNPDQKVVQHLGQGDLDCDPLFEQRSCSGTRTENAAAGRQTPDLAVENSNWAMMTPDMIESLRSHRAVLVENLVVSDVFLSLLSTNNTITDDMRLTIKSELTPNRMADRFLDYLMRRPSLSYKTFIFAMVYTKQQHLALKINAELAEEYMAYIDSEGNQDLECHRLMHSFGLL